MCEFYADYLGILASVHWRCNLQQEYLLYLLLGLGSAFGTGIVTILTLAMTKDTRGSEAIASLTSSVGMLVANVNSLVKERESLSARVNRLEDTIQQLKLDHEKQLSDLRSQHETEISNVRSQMEKQHQAELEKIRANHKTQMDELKKNHAAELEQMKMALEAANKQVIALEAALGRNLSEAKNASGNGFSDSHLGGTEKTAQS